MDELREWLKSQNGGLGTYLDFQQKSSQLVSLDDRHAALYQLLSAAAGRFIAIYDGMPLPTGVAAEALARLRSLVDAASASAARSAEEQLQVLNQIARTDLAGTA